MSLRKIIRRAENILLLIVGLFFCPSVEGAFTVVNGSFDPPEASYLGKTQFEVRGTGFTNQLRVIIEGTVLTGNQLTISNGGTVMRGTLPPLTRFFGEPRRVDVIIDEPGFGRRILNDAFTYWSPLQISNVTPRVFSEDVRMPIAIVGLAFTPETRFEIVTADGVHLDWVSAVNFIDTRNAEGIFPAGLSGNVYIHAIDELNGEEVRAPYTRRISVTDTLPVVRTVTPDTLPTTGGSVVLQGFNFSTSVDYVIGGREITNIQVSGDGRRVTGLAPARPVGTYQVSIFSKIGQEYGPFLPEVQYVEAPSIVSVNPNVLRPLQEIDIAVTHYRNGISELTIDGQALLNPRVAGNLQRSVVTGLVPPGLTGNLVLVELNDPYLGDNPDVWEVEYSDANCSDPAPARALSPLFKRGDVNNDGLIEYCDAIIILEHLAHGEPELNCPDAADFNDDGRITIQDAIQLNSQLDDVSLSCVFDATNDDLGACRYDRCSQRLESVEPNVLSYIGRTQFVVRGSDLSPDMEIRIGQNVEAKDVFRINDSTLRAELPSLEVGVVPLDEPVDLFVVSSDGNTLSLPGGVRFSGPIGLESANPSVISSDIRLHRVTLTGSGFTPRTRVEIVRSGRPENTPLEVTYIGVEELEVLVPSGEVGELYTLKVFDVAGGAEIVESLFPDAILTENTADPVINRIGSRFVPARRESTLLLDIENHSPSFRYFLTNGQKEEIDITINSEGIAEATIPAHEPGLIDFSVETGSGELLLSFDDFIEAVSTTASTVEDVQVVMVNGAVELDWVNPKPFEQVQLMRNGELIRTFSRGESSFTDLNAGVTAAVDYTFVTVDEDGDEGRAEVHAAPWLCLLGDDDPVGERGDIDFRLFAGHEAYSPGAGGGGALPSATQNVTSGVPILRARANQLQPEFNINPEAVNRLTEPNELLTGFRLEEESTKLRIQIHGEQTLAGPNLSLRLLIESVTPGVERVAELIVPINQGGSGHRWMDFTYNTEDPDDLIRESSFPAGPGGGVDAPFPAAAYQVRLYAVGGTDGETHFSISSDLNFDQILVPGVGCAPYPLIHVHDTTGLNSKPQVHNVTQIGSSGLDTNSEDGSYAFVATLLAEATDPDGDSIIRYNWRINMGDEILVRQTAADRTCVAFPDYGIYEVELEAWDNRCGRGKRSFLIQVDPFGAIFSQIEGDYPLFAFPSPRPNILNFINNVPGGMDSFEHPPSQTFSFYVVERSPNDNSPNPPTVSRVQVALTDGFTPLTYTDGSTARVEAAYLNPDIGNQGGFSNIWTATFPDMGRIRSGRQFVILSARARYGNGSFGPWKFVNVYSPQTGNVLFLSSLIPYQSKPAYMDQTGFYTTGSYDPQQRKYQFNIDLAPPGGLSHDFGSTDPIDLNLPDAAGGIPFPALANRWLDIRQSASVSFSKGVWSLDRLDLGTDAVIANAAISADRDLIADALSTGGGGGAALSVPDCSLDFDPTNGEIHLCCDGRIFDLSFDWGIYTGPIFSGPIGIVNVSIVTSIALQASIAVDTVTRLDFNALDIGSSRGDVWLDPKVRASMPVDISAVLFTGIFDVIFDADFDTQLDLQVPVHIGVDSSGPSFDYALKAGLKIDMDWLGCLICPGICPLPAVCVGGEETLFDDDNLFSVNDVDDPVFDSTPCGSGAGQEKKNGGGAGPIVQVNPPDRQLAMASSPSGNVHVAIGLDGTRTLRHFYRARGHEWKFPAFPNLPPGALSSLTTGVKDSPDVIFVNEDVILVSWTQNYSNLDPALDHIDSNEGLSLEEFNAIYGRTDIALQAARLVVNDNNGEIEFIWGQPILFHHHNQINPDFMDDHQADGRAKLALTGITPDQVAVVWTRYDTPDMVSLIDSSDPDAGFKYNLTQTRIDKAYVSVDLDAQIPRVENAGAGGYVSFTNPSINVEPDVSFSQGAEMIVWVIDENHENLHESNVGRNIYYRRGIGFPQFVDGEGLVLSEEFVANAPGIWDVDVALRDRDNGMMIFTALPANAPAEDTGIVNTRLLYYVRYVDGVWQEPELIYEKCNTPIFARRSTLVVPGEGWELEPQFDFDFGIVFSQPGVEGTQLGYIQLSQNVSIDPILSIAPLAPLEGIEELEEIPQMADLNDAVLNIDGSFDSLLQMAPLAPPLEIAKGRNAKGLAEDDLFRSGVRFESVSSGPDLMVNSCESSDASAGPGETVVVGFSVKNIGTAITGEDPENGDNIRVSVEFRTSLAENAPVEILESVTLPALPAGEEVYSEMSFTLPGDTGYVHLVIADKPGELNLANNSRPCQVPLEPPSGVRTLVVDVPTGEEGETSPAVLLNWKNEGIYSSIKIYRDNRLLTVLPPNETSYVDRGPRDIDGHRFAEEHSYRVEAVNGNAAAPSDPDEEVSAVLSRDLPRFIRGDCNSDGDTTGVTDIIFQLSYNFLGKSTPECFAACDANADGDTNGVSDAIFMLQYNFLGSAPPEAPFPTCGVGALITDRILGCESVLPECR